jgi:hypothetical protein
MATNYINIDKITYIGEDEYSIGVDGEYTFSSGELKRNIGYSNFKRNLTQFVRFLKIRKITNGDSDDKFIGRVIYNNPFFTYDMVSSPGVSGAILTPVFPLKTIKIKITIEKVGILKKLYLLIKRMFNKFITIST